MTRSFLTIIALSAVLSMNACTNVTGLDASGGTTGAPRGGDKNPGNQIESPEELGPIDGDTGGGAGDVKSPTVSLPRRQPSDPVEHAPVEGDNSGGDGGSGSSNESGDTSARPIRNGQEGQVNP